MKITNYQALILLELDGSDNTNGKWRSTLAKDMNTPLTTLYNNLEKLKKKKLVEKYNDNNVKKGKKEKRGRNRVYWHITELGEKAVYVIRRGMI